MEFFFYPSSVAVFGSFKKGAIAYEILRNIIEGGFEGDVTPVNPKGGDVEIANVRLKVEKKLEKNVDVAIIAIPAKFVPPLIDEIGDKIKGAVVISAGFSEVGNVELEKELIEKARDYGDHTWFVGEIVGAETP